MLAAETLQYREEQALAENQEAVREMVLKSLDDMKQRKGRDFNKFFDELERRYVND